MSETMPARREASEPLAKAALAAGILAAILFFGIAFAFGDWWFVVALVVGAIAVVLGWLARTRATTAPSDRRLATIGLVLGGIVVVWFLVYVIVASIF